MILIYYISIKFISVSTIILHIAEIAHLNSQNHPFLVTITKDKYLELNKLSSLNLLYSNWFLSERVVLQLNIFEIADDYSIDLLIKFYSNL